MTYPPRFIFMIDADNPQAMPWLAARDWCRGVIVPLDSPPESLVKLAEHPWEIICQMPGHPETCEFQYRLRNLPLPDHAKLLRRAHDAIGERLIWLGLIEEDSSGVAFPQALLRDKPSTHAAAHEMLQNRLRQAIEPAAGLPDLPIAATAGFAQSLHAHAALGVDHLTLERTNDDVDDLQTGIAFCRGAARQHGVKVWGIDFSLWWGAIVGPGEVILQLPASYHRRNLYAAAFSGAQAMIMEGKVERDGWINEADPPALDEVVREVGQRFHNFHPGDIQTPVAVMLPQDHGWMTRPYWQGTRSMCSYARVPCRPGDRGIDGFFGTAFPASTFAMDPFPFGRYQSNVPQATPFGLSCIDPVFAPNPGDEFDAIPYLPFGRYHDRAKAKADFIKNNIDQSPYRPMATSRWGDIFDVFTTSVSIEVLQDYPVLILLGAIELTDELSATLRRYVEAGGELVMAAGVATPQHGALTGVELESEMRVGRAWIWEDEQAIHEAFRYLPARLKPQTAVLASTSGGAPLVTRYPLGNGHVWSTTVPWYEAAHSDNALLCTRLWDRVISLVQPVRIDGLPVQWMSATDGDTRHILILNHDDTTWQGHVKSAAGATDLLNNRELDVTADGVPVTIPPYGVSLLKII